MKSFRILIFAALFLPAPFASANDGIEFPQVETPQRKIFVGEKLTYRITYFKIPIGAAEAEVKEIVEIQGRRAYHIVVHVRSFPIINLVYEVRDEHHSYIDLEKLHSLKYEKHLKEGRFKAREIIDYDQINHRAHLFYPDKKSGKTMPIPDDAQDQLSCGYFFRTLQVKPESSIVIPVNADEKNWALEVKMHKVKTVKIKGVGRFRALETEPLIQFRGIFIKKGKIRGWISLDERRIPIKMKVKIPVLGSVVAELSHYEPGAE